MARYGYLFCQTCSEQIFLGKWLREGNVGFGFAHGTLGGSEGRDSPALGRKVLRFIARHMDHKLLSASDEGGLAEDLFESNEYVDADDVYDSVALDADPKHWESPRKS